MKNRGMIVWACFLVCTALLSGCLSAAQTETPVPVLAAVRIDEPRLVEKNQVEVKKPVQPMAPPAVPAEPEDHPTAKPRDESPTQAAALPTPIGLPRTANSLPAEQWKEWPVLPSISAEMRVVYQRGLKQGNNPKAFSVLGDCQSMPEVFMGVFDSDPASRSALPDPLRETVVQFSGSFDRYSPTVKDGTTEGALLWAEWNDNKEKKCTPGETPLDCELRVQKPSVVFIHIGTHWEARNLRYLKLIIERLLEDGAVPVLVTKADNRELDERVNQNMAFLAAEYNLPLWNFWASVQHLPDNGMKHNSDMYLSEEGIEVHRLGALDALDAVWRAVRE